MEETTPRRLTLLPFLLAVAVVAAIGALAAGNASAQYADLQQPAFAPPSWLFGPVWTVLYLMIGIAGWWLWRAAGLGAALSWWIVQLVLNLAWTPLFFAADLLGWALVEIAALLCAVVVTIVLSWRRSRRAALMLVPYLGWVGFAAALNAAIWHLN